MIHACAYSRVSFLNPKRSNREVIKRVFAGAALLRLVVLRIVRDFTESHLTRLYSSSGAFLSEIIGYLLVFIHYWCFLGDSEIYLRLSLRR